MKSGRFAPLTKERCLEVIREESDRLAQAALRGLEARVPRYPDWNVADLVVHTGLIHDWVERIVSERASERLSRNSPPKWEGDAAVLIGWFHTGAGRLLTTLSAADPATEVWSFAGEGRVSFWLRRMAHETATHRWDAESAVGTAQPFADDLAVSGIAESLQMHLPQDDASLAGNGELVALAASRDGDVLALLELRDGGVQAVRSEAGAGTGGRIDATVRGELTDLWLMLTARAASDALSVEGDIEVYRRLVAAIGRVGVPGRPAR